MRRPGASRSRRDLAFSRKQRQDSGLRTPLKPTTWALVATILVALLSPASPLKSDSEAQASGLSLTFEATTAGSVILGELASRTKQKPLTVSSGPPYTVTGTDSRTNQPYSYQTDVNYAASAPSQRESDERSASMSYQRTLDQSHSGRSGLVRLYSSGGCASNNNVNGLTTYCAVFGPEVWTAPFDATEGQALSFDYAATAGDNYEVYAFLVSVAETSAGSGTYNYGGAGTSAALDTHSLILHRRGKTADWTTASGSVPATGKYRFRFVDGAYDQTGGYALGTDFYIDPNSVRVGNGQSIAFTSPGDQIGSSGTFTVAATSSSGLPVTFSSSTSGVCTVSGTTVTKRSVGTCTLSANAAEGTVSSVTYVAAQSVTRSFQIRAAATAPQSTGRPTIFGSATTGTTLTIDEGTWNTGGADVTATTIQWKRTKGGTTADISGATTSSLCLADDPDVIGSTITVTVTKTNSVGSTSASSVASSVVSQVGSCSTPPTAPTIGSIAASGQTLTIAFAPPADNGGAVISRYEYSTDSGVTWRRLSPDVASSPMVIENLSSDGTTRLTNGTAYPVTIRAFNGAHSVASNSVSATPGVPVVAPISSAPVIPPAVVTPPRVLPRVLPTPPPVVGPVVQNGGVGSLPPSQPTALVGGRPLAIQTQVTDPNTMSLRAGVLNIGMNVASDQGSVRQQGSSAEIQVRNGGVASVNGSGLLPRSTVQVFMPLQGSNSREIARIPVDATGAFSGDALFGATPSEAPLPIGRHVLQMVTVDENRQQTVVEMTVNIAQPSPAPELNRSTNERPALLPGQSIATNGGQPEAVTVTPIPDQKQATIQGDGWSMAVGVEGENGGVSSGEGGAVVTFVRDQGAVVSGEGFMPGTRADVWLFSDPTLLGTVDIDENGEFNGTVNIDGNVVTVGEHTLQLQGVGEDGYVRSANLGVTVADEAPALTEESSWSFLWLLLVLLGVVVVGAGGTWLARRARA